jgi:hypothetical protein
MNLLESTLDIKIGDLVQNEWLPLGRLAEQHEHPANIDIAIVIGAKDATQNLEIENISHQHFVRNILGCSNVLHLQNGTEKILAYLSLAKCFAMRFGTLRERIDFLLSLQSDSPTK